MSDALYKPFLGSWHISFSITGHLEFNKSYVGILQPGIFFCHTKQILEKFKKDHITTAAAPARNATTPTTIPAAASFELYFTGITADSNRIMSAIMAKNRYVIPSIPSR